MVNFQFAWCYKQNLETILYPSFTDLNKLKVSLLHEETSEIEKNHFVGCYATWPNDRCSNINVYQNMYSCEISFYLVEIQQSSLIIAQKNKRNMVEQLLRLIKTGILISVNSLFTLI